MKSLKHIITQKNDIIYIPTVKVFEKLNTYNKRVVYQLSLKLLQAPYWCIDRKIS